MPNLLQSTIRSATSLTSSYIAATTLTDCGRFNQLVLNLAYTKGSLTTLYVKIEFSNDNSTFAQETKEDVSTGALTLYERSFTGTGNPQISIPVSHQFIKVSVKGDSTQVDSSLAIEATLNDL